MWYEAFRVNVVVVVASARGRAAFRLRQGLLFPLTLSLIPGSQMAFPLPSSLTAELWSKEKMAQSRPSGVQDQLF